MTQRQRTKEHNVLSCLSCSSYTFCACNHRKAPDEANMVRVGAILLNPKERLVEFMCSAPRSRFSQKTTYVCNVLALSSASSVFSTKHKNFSKISRDCYMSVCASAGLDAHRLGLVCLSLRIYTHVLLDSGILFYIPHFPESESKQSLPASCPAAVCSAFSKMAHNVENVHCPSSLLQKFEFATNMFCAFEISPLGEKYISYCSFPPCSTHQITTVSYHENRKRPQ